MQDGTLDLDEPIAARWAEFAAAGKNGITVRDVLTHRSGVIGVDGGFTADELADDAVIAARLASQRPYWKPGSAIGYSGFVEFAIVAEVVRRYTGRSLRDIYDERIRSPYGLDLYLGLPEAEEPRFREIEPGPASPDELAALWSGGPGPHSLTGIGYALNSNPPLDQVAFANTRRVRALGPASAGGVGNARGLAGLYTAAVFGLNGQPPLLKPDTLGEFTMLHSTGFDLVAGQEQALRPRVPGQRPAIPVPQRTRLRPQRVRGLGSVRRPAQRHHLRLHPPPILLHLVLPRTPPPRRRSPRRDRRFVRGRLALAGSVSAVCGAG
nr:serine hydrolase domain-containing protein [Nocardia tengchongensis]